VMHCIDCHGDGDSSQPRGLHTSPDAPLLTRPFFGVRPSNTGGICYKCHKYTVYLNGVDDVSSSASLFGSAAEPKLHNGHDAFHGLSCGSCHVGHGSVLRPHLLRGDIGLTHAAEGAECTNECHGAAAARSYSRS
jgi:hypothetical protein